MKKFLLILTAVLCAAGCVGAFAREHGHDQELEKEGAKDDVLIQAAGGWHWVGHAQSNRSFITCYGTLIAIESNDKIVHGASCEAARAVLHLGVQRAISLYASLEGLGVVRLDDAYSVGKYALAKWAGEGGTKGKSILLNDGEAWHVLTFGSFNEREARARGVSREILGMLTAAR
jgi:hypothetical protein